MADQNRRSSSSHKLEFEERRRISFHIAGVRGLPHSGWQPVASTYIQLENLETRQSYNTEYRKNSSSILWGENLPIMDLTDSNKIRFEVRSHMLWSKAVLGRTESFSIEELLRMQIAVGEERDAYIDLVVTPTPPIFTSPKSPRSPSHRRSMSSPVGLRVPLSPTRTRASISPTEKTPAFPSPNVILLSLRIRETAAKDRNHTLTAADFQRFVEKCQVEALVELRASVEKLVGLRNAFQTDGSSLVTLLDIVLGTAEGVRKAIADTSTRNINQNTVACIRALNEALIPYQDLSARQLEKLGEGAATLMREMLCSAVRALESVSTFLAIDNVYVRDKFEFKVTRWLRYFEDCERYLMGVNPNKPDVVTNQSRRARCPSYMYENPELPKLNFLPMSVPNIHINDPYNRSNALLVSEWIFASTSKHPFLPPGRYSTINRQQSNIMCLSGPSGSGKTNLAAHLSQWLSEMGCLGGYFTFDHQAGLGPSAMLDTLPLTLIHQAATVEPDLSAHLKDAFSKHPSAVTRSLEPRFTALFVEPLLAFLKSRLPSGGAWNPLPPMVFFIDGLGVSEASNVGMIGAFAEWMTGKGVRALPAHVKFLLLTRPEVGLEQALRQREANCVYLEMEPEVHCVSIGGVESPGGLRYFEPSGADPSMPAMSRPPFKVLLQSF